jgi:eukaryotic-like serine/threonine-protein kinase
MPHVRSLIAVVILVPQLLMAQSAMFRGGPDHRGEYAASGVPAFGGLAWRVQTSGPVRGSATIIGESAFIGSSDGHVYAIHVVTGDVRWRRNLSSPVMSTPAVYRDLVLVGTYDGTMHALRARTGNSVWQLKTGAATPLRWGFESGETWTSSATVLGGVAVFGARDGFVYAVNARTGARLWRYAAGARVVSSPAIADGMVFVGGQDGVLHAIDFVSGRARWRFETEGTKLQSGNFGFDRTTIQSSPAVGHGLVFFGARDGWGYAVDAATGRERWRVDHKVSWINTSPAISDGMVYVGSSDGRFIQALDATTGGERWRAPSQNIVWSSPAVDRERVYIGEGDGTLYAFDKKTGREAWRYRAGGRIMSSPVVEGNRVIFGSDDGGVYAVKAAASPEAALRRAVFWDSSMTRLPLSANHERLKTYLVGRGYTLLDAAALGTFLAERVRDRAPSVVLFAIDHVPASVAPVAADTVLLRRYLNAGGSVVTFGAPPRIAPADMRSLLDLQRDAPTRIIGVRYTRGNFDPLGVTPNALGERLGFSDWYLDNWGAMPQDVTTVFATDEHGNAAAWIKNFGGPNGTGFIRLPAGDGSPGRPLDFILIQSIAELRPR